MKVIILGAGFIASHLSYEIAEADSGGVPYRLTPNEEDMHWFIEKHKPDIVINTIGWCGRPNVDSCENEKTKTYMSNVVIPLMLAEECDRRNVHLIHISSGCIFFGKSPNQKTILEKRYLAMGGDKEDNAFNVQVQVDTGWKETDFANPKSYYSKTKYACDLALGQMKNVTCLRIRMPISWKNTPRNFINKVRGYSKVINAQNSVTFMDDLAQVVDWVINNQKIGIYHVTNPETLSASDIMHEYQKYDYNHKFEIITESELDSMTLAKRSNCILDNNKLLTEGFSMTPAVAALEKCMKQYFKDLKINE